MTEEVTDAILSCPFCGAVGKPQYHNHSMTWHVRCPDWKCPGKTSCEDQSVAIAAWNTRSASNSPTTEEVTEAMRDAIVAAWLAGARAVHDEWARADEGQRFYLSRDHEPDFTEAAHDYAAS